MDSTRNVSLTLDHKLEPTQQVDEFTIKFNVKTSEYGSVSAERSFSFTLQEFIDDDDDVDEDNPEMHEFYHFLIESVGEDKALILIVRLVLLACKVRSKFSRDLRVLLTLFMTFHVLSNDLEDLSQEALHESFDDMEARFKPASKLAIDSLSRRRLEEQSCREEDKKCNICLEDLAVGEEVASLPCFHEFHDECVVKWLETSHVCPLCRFELLCEQESESESEPEQEPEQEPESEPEANRGEN